MRRLFTALVLISLFAASASASMVDEAPSLHAEGPTGKIHYKSFGEGKEALVFIHGWTVDMRYFEEQVKHFAPRVRVIAIDLPGHGLSDKPEADYTQPLFADAVRRVLDKAGVDRAVLVGHSMGMSVARNFYRANPKRTAGIVSLDGAVKSFFTDQKQIDAYFAAFRGPGYKEAATKFVDGMLALAPDTPYKKQVRDTMLSAPQHVVASSAAGMFDLSLWKDDPIDVPSMIINAKSPFWTADYEKYAHSIMPKLDYVVLDGVSHFLHTEKPAEVNAHIDRFLAKHRLLAQKEKAAQRRPVNTYSIVARDPQTGQIGVAVQSHWFAVGQIVPWAESGVGAIATQSFVDPSYGKLGLDLLRSGRGAAETLRALLTADRACEVRQVGVIDAAGNVATFTGGRTIVAAGGIAANQTSTGKVDCGTAGGTLHVGRDFAVQANLMANDRVWPAMAKAYTDAKGDLADRMLAALDAAQREGGDIRGKQSAALIVVQAKPSGKPWQDRIFDVRVDDAPDPLAELRRLVTVQRAYNHMNAGDLAVEHKDNEAALREYSAAEKIASATPGTPKSRLAEMIYWHAVSVVAMGRVDEALPLFARAFELEPSWRELTPRLRAAGLLPDDAALMERIVRAK